MLAGKRSLAQLRAPLRGIGRKAARQGLKDYVLWPALAGPWFLYVLAANAVANIIRNLWTFVIIFCGHFPAGVHYFRVDEVAGETRARWYVRQLLGSCNIGGGRLFHVMSGNLSHQIEHHLFPDMPSNRYPEIAPRVRALCARYGLPYNTELAEPAVRVHGLEDSATLTSHRRFGDHWWPATRQPRRNANRITTLKKTPFRRFPSWTSPVRPPSRARICRRVEALRGRLGRPGASAMRSRRPVRSVQDRVHPRRSMKFTASRCKQPITAATPWRPSCASSSPSAKPLDCAPPLFAAGFLRQHCGGMVAGAWRVSSLGIFVRTVEPVRLTGTRQLVSRSAGPTRVVG